MKNYSLPHLFIQPSRFLFRHFTLKTSNPFLQRREERILVVVFVVVVMFVVVVSRDVKQKLHGGALPLPGLLADVVSGGQVP